MMTPEKQRNENAILVTEKKLVTGDDNNDISLSTIRFFGYGFAFGNSNFYYILPDAVDLIKNNRTKKAVFNVA